MEETRFTEESRAPETFARDVRSRRALGARVARYPPPPRNSTKDGGECRRRWRGVASRGAAGRALAGRSGDVSVASVHARTSLGSFSSSHSSSSSLWPATCDTRPRATSPYRPSLSDSAIASSTYVTTSSLYTAREASD